MSGSPKGTRRPSFGISNQFPNVVTSSSPPVKGPEPTLATHQSVLSSKRWPADEARPVTGTSTPTKRGDKEKGEYGPANNEVLGLDMSGFKIKALTPAICRFTFLTELRLSNNFLSVLPAGLGNLRSLAFLDLSNNSLEELPSEMGWLTNLRELLLFNNNIQDFPSEFGYLYQLENFAIDGNPLNESLLQIVHQQGALSIIPFLRDHFISSITLLCYNILCDKYATAQMYGYVPSWFLNWEYRKQLIIHEILSYDADIVCLQEVEASQFEQYFKPQLRMRGSYDGVFSPKSRARTMSEWDRSFVDGCATFFKADKFKLEEKTLVEFNQMAMSRPSLRKHKDVYNRVMTRDQIAVITRLEHKETRQEVIVANVHIHWDPSFRDVKLIQTIILVEELEKLSMLHPKASVILCGDLNSLPGSGVCSFLETGSVPADHPDFMTHTYEPYTSDGARHGLSLRNAYSFIPEPMLFSNYTPNFLGLIDYIWFRPGSLSVSGCLGTVSADYIKQIVGLPSQHLPSDHVSLLVEFKVENSNSNQGPPRNRETVRYSGSNPDLSGNNSQAAAKRLFSRNKNAMT